MTGGYNNDQSTLHQYVDNLLRLKERLADSVRLSIGMPLWVWRETQAQEARLALSHSIATLGQYDDTMQHRNTRIFPATVGLTGDIEAINKINALHDLIRGVLQQMDRQTLPVAQRVDPRINTQSRAALHRLGYARLNRKEAFRQWPVLDETPVYLGFYWARTRKIERIDRPTLIERLDNRLYNPRYSPLEKTQFSQDLQALQCVGLDSPLAMIHEHTQPEVNVRFADGRTLRRRAVCPLFFPFEAGQSWPKIKGLSDQPKHRQQKVRQDKRWQDTPCIKSLPVFRQMLRSL